ncbi:MAG TPA: SIMPL domain-containing protein [Caulobacteraceae bacterium]
MSRISGAFVGAMLAAAGLAGAARAETGPPDRAFAATTLNLSAQGETDAAPDKAVITLGVQIKAATAGEAMRQDAARMARVIAALRAAGIAEKDIQTSNLSLGAQYDYAQNQPPKLNGYLASNDVTITVNDLARLGPAVDASVAAGADQVNGVSFGLKDSRAAEDAARKAAVAALQAKAELYAAATGYRVQRLVNLSEGGGYQLSPVRPMAMMKAADAATPIAPGQLTVRVDISGLYELAK